MEITVAELIKGLDEIAPFEMAESWDNVGLIVGDLSRRASAILVGLDPTNRLLDEAIAREADTVITHHPAIFKPIPHIDISDPSGKFLEKALTHKLNIIACHTNFDSVHEGVNDILAQLLHLQEISPLVPVSPGGQAEGGMGRIGRYGEELSGKEFIQLLLDVLELPSVQVAGEIPETIKTVALCGGSGSDLAVTARNQGADVFVSAELKHSVGRWAEEIGFCVIDGTHYATEKPAVRLLAERLTAYSKEHDWNLEIYETNTENHPFSAVNKNR